MRSYRDEWQEWGIVTGLQTLLMLQHENYTAEHILQVARMYGVDNQLLHRMSYVPPTIDEVIERQS
jgi:hypothetical protein